MANMTLASNSEFKSWVSLLKKDIRSAQIKAAIKVNTELLRLYWRMGADICEKQKSASWGDGWLKDQFYNEQLTIWQQLVAKLDDVNMQQLVAQLQDKDFKKKVMI